MVVAGTNSNDKKEKWRKKTQLYNKLLFNDKMQFIDNCRAYIIIQTTKKREKYNIIRINKSSCNSTSTAFFVAFPVSLCIH